ncbi:cold-shock protein [Arthrobacter castelli]|uniref:cold-shock protein n=1 Tax=Arthrobacter castelli TaxID=271431 RepID=UPI000417707A|nr:cold-shock protein [Arthrobacter castelli]
MLTGTVKWFNRRRGYGVIRPDQGGEDVFAHYSAITGHGYRFLYPGQRVQFETAQATKDPHAVRIQRLGPGPGRKNR